MPRLRTLPSDEGGQVEEPVARAQAAWDEGLRCFIYKASAFTVLKDESLTVTVDAILGVGWHLHSTALVYNQSGLKGEQAMFTFLRPTG